MSLISFGQSVLGGGLLAMLAIAILLYLRQRWPRAMRRVIYCSLAAGTMLITLTLAGLASYRLAAATVHDKLRQAYITVWACDQQLQLQPPVSAFGSNNGSASVYFRNDRLFVNGPLDKPVAEASLGVFFTSIGGQLNNNALILPTTSGMVHLASGTSCGNSKSQPQVYVYHHSAVTNSYWQQKIANPADYVLAANRSPIADCLVVEFGPPRDRTNKLCPAYVRTDYFLCRRAAKLPVDRCVDQELPTAPAGESL